MLEVLLLPKSLSAWREKNGCVIICYCYRIGSKHTQILAILCTVGEKCSAKYILNGKSLKKTLSLMNWQKTFWLCFWIFENKWVSQMRCVIQQMHIEEDIWNIRYKLA